MSTKSSAGISKRSLIKSTSIISLGTLSSRILGFVRDVIIAHMLGTGWKADAFFVAQRIPNLFRDLVGEGAANAAVVPVFSEYVQKKDPQALKQFVSTLALVATGILTAVTVLGIIFAPVIVRLIAPGFSEIPGQVDLTIRLTQILFPYLIFIGLTAYSTGILFTFRLFLIPAFSPCLLNIAFIVGAVLSVQFMKEPVYGLAVSVVIGGIAQLLVQIKPVRDQGIKIEIPDSWRHPGTEKVGKLLVPRLFGSAVYQLNIFIDTFFASLVSIVGAGGISAIYYANRIIQFPLGVFGVALVSVLLPTLSTLAAQKDTGQYKKTLAFALKGIFLIMLPLSVLCLTLPEAIIRVIFERGEFGGYSTQITSLVLFFYAFGLVSFAGSKILVAAFHSLQDTKTPVKIAAVSLGMSLLLNSILIHPFKVGGIALASVISATVNFGLLFYCLHRKLGAFTEGMRSFLGKILLAAILMAIAVVLGWPFLSAVPEALRLLVVGGCGVGMFYGLCFVLKVDYMKETYRWILRRA